MLASICIPTVDRIEFFQEALESAASQSFDDYEILVSVNTPEPGYFALVERVVEEATVRHPARAIRLAKPAHFLHIFDHLNFMVEQTESPFCCLLSDDDRLDSGFLQTLLPLLQSREDAGFAFCDFNIIGPNGSVRGDSSAGGARISHRHALDEVFVPGVTLASLVLRDSINMNAAVFRRSVLEQFPFASGNEAADREFWLRIADAPAAFGAIYVRATLLNYRLHAGQYSKLSRASQADLIRALERCRFVAEAEPELHNRELARAYAKLGKASLDEGDHAGAWKALRIALRKKPLERRTYRFVIEGTLPAFSLRFARRVRDRFASSG